MNQKLFIIILLHIVLSQFSFAQLATYTVTKSPISSDLYDEYSPVYYKNGIVFSSNRTPVQVSSYSTGQNQSLFKIYYIDTTGNVKWQNAQLLSKTLKTKLNDGPVTFSKNSDTIYYSRNLEIEGNTAVLSTTRNKLGIFSAILVGEDWTKIKELRINNEWYNVTTPWLSPDGKRLFFASDKPGGFGGSDLYYSQWKTDYWDNPVNLGPVINTSGNEAYPFINPDGDLFFSSDGHPGLGGKDIFFSRYAETAWLPPVPLDPPINSKSDDFGIITDTLMNEGYFSSNRDKSIDIFHFRTNFPQVFYTGIQKENQYCFMFSDSGDIFIDNLNLKYVWDFGDGEKASGAMVSHCFPGAGKYMVKLDIVDRTTGNLFFSKLSYNLELKDYEQPYITSPETALKEDLIDFDGLKSYLPGYKILNYSWDFGDGTRARGEKVSHAFKETGEFQVNLVLTIKSDSTGNVEKKSSSKKVSVVGDIKEQESSLSSKTISGPDLTDIKKYDNAFIDPVYSAEKEFKNDVEFLVEILSSNIRLNINDKVFSNVLKKYEIKEFPDLENGKYSYVIDQQMSLMATYLTYKEIRGYGFNNAVIKTRVLKDPAEKELNNLKKIFGTSADLYFDSNSRLTSNAYLLLDQVTKLMIKYPEVQIEVAVYTDNTGIPENKLTLSQRQAQTIINYIIDKGIDKSKLVSRGYGGARPVAPNFLASDRALNRRIDLSIVGSELK
jgi:outer membrane protein OmpA-like peptidoglycan-associated protein